jgi:hypothetical protein
MRSSLVVVMMLLAGLSAGCPGDCLMEGKQDHEITLQVPPGSSVPLTLTGCSTCDHAQLKAMWDSGGSESTATGTIDLVLSPQCFVRDTKMTYPPTSFIGLVDTNVKNCGAIVDYSATVTNNTNVMLPKIEAYLVCATVQ